MVQRITIRHDDFDFRLTPAEYIANHENFIKHGLVETAVIQLATKNCLNGFNQEIVDYLNQAPNWDLQLHGFNHDHYNEMNYNEIVRDLSAALYWFGRLFGKYPTRWFTPWNCYSDDMKRAATKVGLEIDNESWDIAKFVREFEVYDGHSLYFHLWRKPEKELIPKMLKLAKIYEGR